MAANDNLSNRQFPEIAASEARGDSRPVTSEEFQGLARRGSEQISQMAANASPTHGLNSHWPGVKAHAFGEAQKSWGGVTVNTHTGKALATNADKYAITAKHPGQETISMPEHVNQQQFSQHMNQARKAFPQLSHEGHHLGVFHDDEKGTIDIDPVVVVNKREDVDTIGAATRAIGGAYHFKSGDGFWPPHVKDEG